MLTPIAMPRIVGILNTTPNSFYDGGKFMALTQALDRVEQMLSEGADIIEVGGESTGPNSPPVLCDEEIIRTIPIIREIHARWPKAVIAVDTYKSRVATEAIAAGATMINDVTAGRSDAALLTCIAAHPQVQYVLMYAKDATPRTTIQAQEYDDVVRDITHFLQTQVGVALQAGIKKEQLILDPGLGHFVSSEAKFSLHILRRLSEFSELGFPILLSPSRKSCLAGKEKVGPDQRLPATLAATAIATVQGVSFIRTHDVVETRRACELVASICNS